MTMMAHVYERHTILGRVGGWWKKWWERAATLAELEACGCAEMERIARDTGVGAGDLRVLAGKWPDSADLVGRRLTALGIDATEVGRSTPEVMRDLQRVCSVCADKRVCEHDLDRGPAHSGWLDYCPNVETLHAVCAQFSRDPGNKGT
jgi:hypothetical protein